MTLDPDWDRAIKLDLAGILRIMTVRHEGALVGFCFNYVISSLLYAGLEWATTEGFWLDPLYREGSAGIRLFKENEVGLRKMNVAGHTIEIMSHIAADRGTVGKILNRLGYEIVGHTYGKTF